MAINLKDTIQIIRGKKADIAARIGTNGELNWAEDTYELYIHDGKTRGGHIIGKSSGTVGVVGGAGIAVSTSDGISTVSVKRDPSNVLYATTDGAGVRIGTSGALQITAQNALDLRVAEGGGIIVDSNGVKIDSAVLSSVFRYAGQVNSVDDLPSDAQPGDVYDVKDSGANYVWSGSSWDNLGGIMSVDAAPTQGSTNPVASGGVYDAIQGAKLSGDGTTVTVTDNTITAQDIAIDGDLSDLASTRGLLKGFTIYPASTEIYDLNTFTKYGHYFFYTQNASIGLNFPSNVGGILVVEASTNRYIRQVYYNVNDSNRLWTRNGNVSRWSNWSEIILSSSFGNGFTINEKGIVSANVDDVTIENNSEGQLVAKDIAIGGNESDLASESGLLGKCVYVTSTSNPDFDIDTRVFDTALINVSADIPGTFPTGITGWCVVVQYNYNRTSAGSRVQLLYNVAYGGFQPGRAYIRYYWSSLGRWVDWNPFLTAAQVGDGITVNNGIISVPEYEGATASTAATSGLVPPAAAGDQDKVLRGDGEWGEYLPLSGGTMSGKITSTASTALEQKATDVSISDTSRSSGVNKMLAASLDKNGKRGGGVELQYGANGSRKIHFSMRNRADTAWLSLGLYELVDGSVAGVSPNPKANSDTTDIATTAWVRDRLEDYLSLAGGTMTGAINNCIAFGKGITMTGSVIEPGSYNVFYKEITADTTFTMRALPSGSTGIAFFTLFLSTPGSHVITWPANWYWTGDGTSPELGSYAIINVVTTDGGNSYYPTLALNRD